METTPAVLVSYMYLERFTAVKNLCDYRNWALDSGAFTAHQKGIEISLPGYIETARRLRKSDPSLTEIFALDVIGDWKKSIQNTEKMWSEGIEAIPTYHLGSPVDALLHLKKNYPKIAIGGVARKKLSVKTQFVNQVFARIWPHKIHGFGMSSEKLLLAYPFHSCDSTSWEINACCFGNWYSFGDMSVRGTAQNLRTEVQYYLKLEAQVRSKWRKDMTILGVTDGQAPTIRLALASNRTLNAIGKPGSKISTVKKISPQKGNSHADHDDTEHTGTSETGSNSGSGSTIKKSRYDLFGRA